MHRLIIALVCGIVAGTAAGYATYALAGTDYERGDRGAGRFIFMAVGGSFAIVFKIVHLVLVRRDKRRWDAERFPEARIKR